MKPERKKGMNRITRPVAYRKWKERSGDGLNLRIPYQRQNDDLLNHLTVLKQKDCDILNFDTRASFTFTNTQFSLRKVVFCSTSSSP